MMGLKSTVAHSSQSPHICSQFFQLHGTQIVVRRPRLRGMIQQQMQATSTTLYQEPTRGEAPPKQVATALDRLAQAARLIADIRLGADRILEALFAAALPHQTTKPLHFFSKEDASIRQHLQDLRSLGRLLEETGVINESLRSRSNSWGLHMPVVCPDGAVVAYAWKRQLAGQAGASAVDRTRLALKAFTDQKRRFFPHLDDGPDDHGYELAPKRHCGFQEPAESYEDNESEYKTLSDVLTYVEKEASAVKIFRHQRLDWLKRASALPSSADENLMDPSKEYSFHRLDRLRPSPVEAVPADKVAVIELLVPSIFRAVISLHPADSVDPDSVAFFSPDEDHADMALQFFTGIKAETALLSLLHWMCSYQSLFTKVCSKCGRLLSMDTRSSLLLPPVYRPYVNFSLAKASALNTISTTEQGKNHSEAYHIGCFSEEHGQAHQSSVTKS